MLVARARIDARARRPVSSTCSDLIGGTPQSATARRSWSKHIRLPRSLTALLAGAALGIAGLQMQTLFRNPLADPVCAGHLVGGEPRRGDRRARLGHERGRGVRRVDRPASATRCSSAAAIAGAAGGAGRRPGGVRRASRIRPTVLILGLMFGYAASAMVTVLVGVSSPERLMQLAQWGFGSFSGVTWQRLRLFAPLTIAGVLMAAAMTKQLNALLLGENYARSMGVAVRRARAADHVRRLDARRRGDGVLRTDRLSRDRGASPVPRPARDIESSRARPGRRADGRHRGAGRADRLACCLAAPAYCRLNAVTSIIGAPVVVAVLLRSRTRGVRRMSAEPASGRRAPALRTRDLAVGYRTPAAAASRARARQSLGRDPGNSCACLGPTASASRR